jgi:hypothetical protein
VSTAVHSKAAVRGGRVLSTTVQKGISIVEDGDAVCVAGEFKLN